MLRHLAYAGLLLVLVSAASAQALRAANTARSRSSARTAERADERPESFEPLLVAHPEDAEQRAKAMSWYSRHDDRAKLRYHTLKMIEYHPDDGDIFCWNSTAFYADPAYLREVLGLLEEQVKRGHHEHGLFRVLADICDQGAEPLGFTSAAQRRRFLHYYQLPDDAPLPETLDKDLAEKAVAYYRQAVKAAGRDDFYPRFHTQALAELLLRLGRYEEAASACEAVYSLPKSKGDADFLALYGRSLLMVNKDDQAAGVLVTVRASDRGGWSPTPGPPTVEAETMLGIIALRKRDVPRAVQHLMASVRVRSGVCNRSQGFALELAEALLKWGRREAVARFCRIVLRDFTPDEPDVLDLLRRATEPARK